MRNIKFSALYHNTVFNQFPCSVKFICISEAETVFKNEIISDYKIAMYMTDLNEFCGHIAERINNTIVIERSVIRLFVPIAAVSEKTLTLAVGTDLVGILPYSLIDPIPDATTGHAIVLIKHIPIFLEVSDSITHGMRIFAHPERLA